MPTIAVIDDDHEFLNAAAVAFESEGYRTMTYADGPAALDAIRRSPPDLAILDIRMPRLDGMEALRRLRKGSDMPVILLAAEEAEAEELIGFKMGADDVVRKPFSQRLLVERARAVLRRRLTGDGELPREIEARTIECGQICLDPDRHLCTWKSRPVILTVTEFQIVQALVSRPGVVKSRDALMDIAHDDKICVDDRTIDCHIKRIRKKFRRADAEFDMIETLYGIGYRFRDRLPRRA
jgi:two-component system, OmpR family, response regulator ChvI